MQLDPLGELSLAKLAAGIAGSFVSLRFLSGTPAQLLMLAVGGTSLSYFASTPAAIWLNMQNAEGMVGFLIGMFGMAILSKVFEVIQSADAKVIAADIWEWIKRKWGA